MMPGRAQLYILFLCVSCLIKPSWQALCPLGSVIVGGVNLSVPTAPVDWCLGYNTSVRPPMPYTMVGVSITPQGDNFLTQYGRTLWKYLDIRYAIVPNTNGRTIFENLFGMTYADYSAIPAVQSNQAIGFGNQPIVYLNAKDLAKIWILTTDGAQGVSIRIKIGISLLMTTL